MLNLRFNNKKEKVGSNMLWKLFSSEKKVAEAMQKRTKTYSLTPDAEPANNNEEAALEVLRKSRLWLEGWNEEDEARLRDPNRSYGICWSNHKPEGSY
jgi:hypothetical protein